MKKTIFILLFGLLISSCSISYQFNGASVDYNIVKTISIQDFPNQAQLVVPTLSATFSDALRNKFTRQTRLRTVNSNADLELEGEITDYGVKNLAVRGEDALATMAELSVTVKVRYTNNKRPSDDLQQSFTSSQSFSQTLTIDQVQDELITKIVDDLVDQIYNATLGNW
ncbi:MAG: LPS assembly lipoprotein LptE [Candidatus Azobacteroides sp.]|nr:LPS assembly lipoprotein LptE [Candidatus Azobacteroides sp.]